MTDAMMTTMKSLLLSRALFLVLILCMTTTVRAQLSIEITGAGAEQYPIVIPLLENEAQLPQGVTDIVRADLVRSGLFRLIDVGPMALPENVMPDLEGMRGRGADAVLTGTVVALPDGRFEVRFRLFDTQKQFELGAKALMMMPKQNRLTAHLIADFIYETLTGQRGYFATRIAYVVKNGARYELQVADADGANPQAALISREPIISPAWSPDGQRLAYVSFEQKKPIIYIHALSTGRRQILANFKGSNSAPAWSPDGQKLAVVLTKDGQSQLYTLNVDGTGVRRLATSIGIDTEPTWSGDGQWIYFTSDRGGSPQIYRIPSSGGTAQRVTFDGDYNVTPRPSPDGRKLAFVTRSNNRFQVAVQDLTTKQIIILTNSSRDESPSFSPNGRMILYATENAGRGVLEAVSADGRIAQRLTIQAADIREPAWGPFLNQQP